MGYLTTRDLRLASVQPSRLGRLVRVFPMAEFLKALFCFFRRDVAVSVMLHVLLHEEIAGPSFSRQQGVLVRD